VRSASSPAIKWKGVRHKATGLVAILLFTGRMIAASTIILAGRLSDTRGQFITNRLSGTLLKPLLSRLPESPIYPCV
jgi:hypothetical protein